MSLYLMSAGGIMAFAGVLGYGSLADVVGAPTVLFVPGLMFVALVALAFAAAPWLRAIFTRGKVEDAAAAPSTAG
ncbi:MAG: hypothetical protein U5Q44_03645 [Dehalococcoidia bacterium]|nr:hypothetical protein [Dehalococcoidia bacterium]